MMGEHAKQNELWSPGYYYHYIYNGDLQEMGTHGHWKNTGAPWAGHEGRPNWNDDGTQTSHADTTRLTGSGGYGLFQLTYAARNNRHGRSDPNYIMPRNWIWNWQANAVGFGDELQGKIAAGQKLFNALTSTYPQNGPIPNYFNFSALDAIIVTEYNGMYGGEMRHNPVPLDGYAKPQNSCWQPFNGTWRFLQNKESYAQNVNTILNGQ